MTGPPTIARLSGGGRIWALGALLGDDDALEALARAVLSRWQPGDRLVVLGNMLGPNGDPAGTLDGLLRLRRRLMAANRGCGILFLRGAQEEMWQKALSLPFAMTPLEVLDWMLGRGLGPADLGLLDVGGRRLQLIAHPVIEPTLHPASLA